MSLPDALRGEHGLEPPNEIILNVIRKSEGRGIGTSEIVESVNLKHDAVRDRLRGMEAEGLVESETIGSSQDYTLIWFLAEGVRTEPVNPGLINLVQKCELIKRFGNIISRTGTVGAVAGAFTVIFVLTLIVQGINLPGMNRNFGLFMGWVFVILAGGVYVLGNVLISVSILAEWLGERYVSGSE